MNPLRWRKMTWVLLIFSAVMFLWMFAAVDQADCEESLSETEQIGCEAGTGLGVGILFFLWMIGFLILSVIWYMTRGATDRGRRICPACGTQAKEGQTVCRKCGYDYARAAQAQFASVAGPVIEASSAQVLPPLPQPPAALPRAVCPKCGETDIGQGSNFCPRCGAAL